MGKTNEALKKDLDHLHKDWEKLLQKKTLATDKKFLAKMSKDLKKLNNDALIALKNPELKETAELISYMLTSPLGAPFVSDTTLLQAALSFEGGDKSQLSNLMKNFVHYSPKVENQLIMIFDSFLDSL